MNHAVLLIETDSDMRFFHTKFLRKMDPSLDIVVANDPVESIRLIEKNEIELVVSRYELGLDKPTGIDIIKQIRKKEYNIPIILITASGSETALRALEEGADYYIHLDFEDPTNFYRELTGLINRAIELSENRKNHAATQSRFDAVYDNPSIGIMELDNQMNVKDCNETMSSLAGYPLETLRNRSLFSLLSSEETHENGDQNNSRIEQNIIEKPLRRNKGYSCWARLTLSKIEGDCVDDDSLMALTQDITREKELTFSSEDYRRIITVMTQHSHVSRHIVDTTGIVHSVYGRWLEFTGYTEPEIIGMNFLNLLDEDSKSKVVGIIPEKELDSVPLTFLNKNGMPERYIVSSVNMRNKFGEIHRICFISHPIGLGE